MKNKIGLIILILICVALGVALIWSRKQAADQHAAAVDTIGNYSNQVIDAKDQYDKLRQINADLNALLDKKKNDLNRMTNAYNDVSANLARTAASLEDTKKQVADRETKISDLESQNQALDERAVELTNSIANLTTQIADTRQKLAASEGDKEMLTKELNRLIAEKAELERQFNDLNVLRTQVAKLKEELNISRRLQWIREGLFANADQKGAQLLMQKPGALTNQQARPANYDLNVEVTADGSLKVIPPPTNSPAATNPPPAQ